MVWVIYKRIKLLWNDVFVKRIRINQNTCIVSVKHVKFGGY